MHYAVAAATAALATPPPEFHVAPMQCYTSQPFRKLANLLSPSSIKWTEMEKVDDLLPNVEGALEKRLDGEQDDTNLVLQLGSNDSSKLDHVVRVASKHYPNLREINLNCGCPSISSGGAPTYGASLMKDASLTAQLVESMSSATNIDVSVKCRIGVFDSVEDYRALTQEDYEYLTQYISAIHEAGASHVILHARPAILSMSPVKNRIIPELDAEFVDRIASDFNGKLNKVTMNGGITSLPHLHSLQNDEKNIISSHMAGRWCLRRPLDLVGIEQTLGSTRAALAPQKFIEGYIDYASANQAKFPTAELCLPLYLVVEQLREDYEQEEEGELLSWEDIENIHDAIQDGLELLGGGKLKKKSNSINFKKLASSFKPLVGTKVVNKWKRNRAEL